MNKHTLRQHIKNDMLTWPNYKIAESSYDIWSHLFKHSLWSHCCTILAYAHLADEVNSAMLINQAHHDHKKIFLPKVDQHTMDYYSLNSWAQCSHNQWGIAEPVTDQLYLHTQHAPSMLLAPCLAAHPLGYRLGRGRGYYDRYLAQNIMPGTIKILVCFATNIYIFEYEAHDYQFDAILSEQGLQFI